MRVLVLASQKGGSGKSTLASSLAVAAQEDGERVVVVDLDPQRSLAGWGEIRADRDRRDIILRAVAPSALDRWIAQTRQVPGVSLVILDTAGTFGPEVDVALAHADLCLVPVKPSAFDLRAAAPTVSRLLAYERPFAFILNGVSPAAHARTVDAIGALRTSGVVAPPVADRMDFRDAVALGLGVTEVAPRGKAAAEIRVLWDWTKTHLEQSHG